MNNQNYRQNFRNPAGKPSADEPPQTQTDSREKNQPSGYRRNGLRYPQGNQQPYHAGPQPGSQQGGQPFQNGPQPFQGDTQAYQSDSRSSSQQYQQNPPQHGNPQQQRSSQQQGNPQQQNNFQQQGGPQQQNNFQQQGGPQQQSNFQQQGGPQQQNNFQQQGGPQQQNNFQQQRGPQQQGNFQQQGGPQQQDNFQQQGGTQQQGNFQQQGGTQENWMNNPNLKGMDPEKLKMLNNIASQGSQKGMNELLPFLMSAVSQNKGQSGGLDFSRQEMDTIIEVLKMGKPPEEVARINRMMQIIKMMH